MRVMLIYSNRTRLMEPAPPIGLSYVATAARQAGFASNTYLLGVTYGVFSQIMDNYTLAQVNAEQAICQSLKDADGAKNIVAQKNVKLVLIYDVNAPVKNQTIMDLENLGFKPWQNFYNPEYRSTIVGLVRQ